MSTCNFTTLHPIYFSGEVCCIWTLQTVTEERDNLPSALLCGKGLANIFANECVGHISINRVKALLDGKYHYNQIHVNLTKTSGSMRQHNATRHVQVILWVTVCQCQLTEYTSAEFPWRLFDQHVFNRVHQWAQQQHWPRRCAVHLLHSLIGKAHAV